MFEHSHTQTHKHTNTHTLQKNMHLLTPPPMPHTQMPLHYTSIILPRPLFTAPPTTTHTPTPPYRHHRSNTHTHTHTHPHTHTHTCKHTCRHAHQTSGEGWRSHDWRPRQPPTVTLQC